MMSVIDQIQWQALADQARKFTYCLIDRTDQKIGTVIAIRLAQRFFFATARHMIENDHDIEVLSRARMESAVSHFVARHYSEQLDIGLFELAPDNADRFEFADTTRLHTETEADKDLPILVVGYPSQFIRSAEICLNSENRLRFCQCDAFTYRSVVLPQSEWPDNGSLWEPLVPERDLLVDFEPEPRIRPLPPGVLLPDASPVDCPEVSPKGLSGGGIWLANVEDRNGLWISDIRLQGIQTGWYEQKGWLRGVRIEVWLNMVRTKYPDLADSL
jgi:hypothetical protein